MKKKILHLVIGLLFGFALIAQNQITTVEYWFDDDVPNRQTLAIGPTSIYTLGDSLNVSNLTIGLHQLSMRFLQDNNLWSSASSTFFIKAHPVQNTQQRKLVQYEYWLNQDFSNRFTGMLSNTASVIFIDTIVVSQLVNGLNYFTIRFKDDSQLWSSPVTHYFVKDENQVVTIKQLERFKYWFNDNAMNAVIQTIPTGQQFYWIDSLDCSTLKHGVNVVSFQFEDEQGLWSSVISKLFIHLADFPQPNTPNIVACRYWINDNLSTLKEVAITNQAASILWIDSADFRLISAGTYFFNMQFLDADGRWSGTVTDTIVKDFYPFVRFNAIDSVLCAGTNTGFYYDTADVDLLIWDYGNGITDTTFTPNFMSSAPGVYTVSVTAINLDSSITVNFSKPNYIQVVSSFDSLQSEAVCYGDSLLFQGNWLTQDSLYTFVYSTSTGCDSVWQLDLTVLPQNSNTISAAICQGQSYNFGPQALTQAGNYQETFPAANGCDSTVYLNLTVNPVYALYDSAQICAGDQYYFNGQMLNQSGYFTANLQSTKGCDSILNLDLTVIALDTSVTKSGFTLTANLNNASYQWLECSASGGYSILSGANQQSFTPAKNGNFAVQVSANGCKDTSNCHTVAGIAIIEWTQTDAVKIYPNPTSGLVTVDVGDQNWITRIELFDYKQTLLESNPVTQTSTTIDLSTYANGIYIIKLIGDEMCRSARIAKFD